MKKIWNEFVAFINKGNALALAIGVIIGAGFTNIVNAINTKIISPLIGLVLGGYDLGSSEALTTVLKTEIDPETGLEVVTSAIYWGEFIQAVIDFLLTAIILFVIFKIVSVINAAAKRAAEKMHEAIEKKAKEKAEEEVAEETSIVEETPVIEESVTPQDVLLLQEIRDLLANKVVNDKEE